MRNDLNAEYDLIVVGGGPAGSTSATFVAMEGYRVLLLEKQQLPIYKIGESLLPATVHGICPMLGVSKALEEAGFVTKRGGTFRWGTNPEPWTFSFATSSRMPGPTATAYQVERMKFDAILLNNAKMKGVELMEGCAASNVLIEDDRVVGLRFTDHEGRPREARAHYVLDASGHQTPLARHVGERVYSEFFQNLALFGYYQNGSRLPSPNEGNIFCVAFEHGWFWYIPLSPTLTSVGAVVGKEHASKLAQGYESALNEFIRACPPIQQLLSSASRVTSGPYGELRVRKDYSYCHTKFWRPGMALIGDAACFIDPVFSSGVHLATYSGLLAARSINTCLKKRLDEDCCFSEFEARYRREFAHFYDFLLAFYDLNRDIDSYFWHARQVVNSPEAGNQAFVDLVAGIGGSGEHLYASSEDFLRAREGLGSLLFPQSTGEHTQMTRDSRRSEFYNKLYEGTAEVQLQALLKDERPDQVPLFSGGLVATPDGLHWTEANAPVSIVRQT